MKICPNCGTKESDAGKFCHNCGAPLQDMPAQEAPASVPVMPTQKAPTTVPVMPTQKASASVPVMPLPNTNAPSAFVPLPDAGDSGNNKKKKKSGGKIAVAALIVLLLGALVFLMLRFFGASSKAVALQECVDISFAGFEGDGQVISYVNPNTLKRKVEKALGEKVETSEIESMADMVEVEITLKSKASAAGTESGSENTADSAQEQAFSETDISHLSKGDVISVSIRYDALQKAYPDIEFTGKAFDMEVQEGLKSYAELDPFRYMKLAFSGTAPFGKLNPDGCGVTEDCPDEFLPYFQIGYYQADRWEGIAVGDTLHLSYKEDGQRAMREAGYKASQTEFDYVVKETDLSRFVTDVSELDTAAMSGILSEANDRIRSQCASRYGDPDAAELVSTHLLVPKDGNWDRQKLPHLTFLYKAQYEKQSDDTTQRYEEWLAVCSSALWIEVPQDGGTETVSFDIPGFSRVGIYQTQKDAENGELVQQEAFTNHPVQ